MQKNSEIPRYTVGIPFSYEKPEWFALAIQSVFAQTENDWELVLVGDAPSSELIELAHSISDPRVSVVIHKERSGVPKRLNEITQCARGKYVIRMDADDVMHPSRIEVQGRVLDAFPSVDVVCSQATLMDESSSPQGKFAMGHLPAKTSDLFTQGSIIHPTTAFRRSWLLQHPYDETMIKAQDKELWIRTSAPDKFHSLEQELLLYRYASNNNYSKHALTAKHDRKILHKHGISHLGRLGLLRLYSRSHLRQLAYRTLTALRLDHILYRAKHDSSQSSVSAARNTLTTVSGTPVPGWEKYNIKEIETS